MLRFISFIGEAVLRNSGSDAPRHAEKYITPFIDSNNPTHSIAYSTNVGLSAGTRVHVHGYEVDEQGNHHALVSTTGNRQDAIKVPFSKLSKPKAGYSDEHAIKNLWNHSVKNNLHGSVESMHAEIEKAKNDPNHPLSFEKADNQGFIGKDKGAKGAREAYYTELKTAAHTVHKIAQSQQGNEKIKSGDSEMSVAGGNRHPLQNTYTKYGLKHASPSSTGKTDLRIGKQDPMKLSVKKTKGSQLASSESADFQGIVHSAAHAMHKDGHITRRQRDQMIRHGEKIAEVQKKAPTALESEHETNIKEGQTHLKNLLDVHPLVNTYLRKEATTGEGKFGSHSEATPTHVVKHGLNSSITPLKQYDHSGKAARFTKGKGPKREYTVRMDT